MSPRSPRTFRDQETGCGKAIPDHQKLKGFEFSRNGDVIVIEKISAHVIDGIVTGIIIDLIAFPLLALCIVVGLWMLFITAAQEHSWLAVGMGLMFSIMGVGLFWLLLLVHPGLFPFQCRFQKTANGVWAVQRKLWFFSSGWRNLGEGWSIWCCPFYMRGDWGCTFFIKETKAKRLLVCSGVFTASKSAAHREGLKELDFLKALFDVPGEMKRWS
jgi:hypothetical protein